MTRSDVTIAIPTFGRETVLCDTIRYLEAQTPPSVALFVIDQTPVHEAETARQLQEWYERGRIRWVRLNYPSVVRAMNVALRDAGTDIVLFLDDDIVPGPGLVAAHVAAYGASADVWAVAGQVLQPGESAVDEVFTGGTGGFRAVEKFPFHSSRSQWTGNVMAGNLSVRRDRALQIGGFDENFLPPVAFRFETEFARRMMAAGGRIRFEPTASIRHLRAISGGTRSTGTHLSSGSPLHGVGDYYYALRCGHGWGRWAYMIRRPFREVRTRFHLRHPWYIPVKFVGELRALAMAVRLNQRGPGLMDQSSCEEPR